jgi:hypothetical protein
MDLNQPTQTAANIPTKFNQEEITELSGIRQGYEETTLALGQLELQKREVKKNEVIIEKKITAIENQEKVFLDKIVAKYGEGTFDINTGIFSPKRI